MRAHMPAQMRAAMPAHKPAHKPAHMLAHMPAHMPAQPAGIFYQANQASAVTATKFGLSKPGLP